MKPLASHYPRTVMTLGDHIRKRRIDLGLLQRDLAEQLGVSTMTVNYWETNRNQPSLRMIPRIIRFLSYVPDGDERTGETFGEWIVRGRRTMGIRQKDLARQIGVDPTTLARWEHGESEPSAEYRQMLKGLLGDGIGD